jgi:hypothetical protein
VIQTQRPPIIPSLFEKRKIGVIFLDANLIWVAPERGDTGGLACLYHGTFGRKCIHSEALKECVKKRMLGMGLP